jgi:hypothetical protein
MDLVHQLTPMLKSLRFSGILEALELRNRGAIESKLSYVEFLAQLVEDEVSDARSTSSKCGFAAPRSIHRRRSCRFIERHENVFFVGPATSNSAPRTLAAQPLRRTCAPEYYVDLRRAVPARRASSFTPRHSDVTRLRFPTSIWHGLIGSSRGVTVLLAHSPARRSAATLRLLWTAFQTARGGAR